MRILKWLYPGMRVKRWIILSTVGIILVVLGTIEGVSEVKGHDFPSWGMTLVFLGVILVFTGTKRMVKSFITIFMPKYKEKELVDIVYKNRQLSRGPRIVVSGGWAIEAGDDGGGGGAGA